MTHSEWAAVRAALFELGPPLCVYCLRPVHNNGRKGGEGYFSADHIVPVVHGGTNDPDNLAVSCKSCNTKKGGKSLLVFLAERAD